jgi:hypothetical protein
VPKPPQFIKGVDFNEEFFDAAFKNAGGCRLETVYPPPPGTKNADYLLKGFVVEQKTLTQDALADPKRQERALRFLREELPRGPLWVTANTQAISFTGAESRRYWEQVVGLSIQDRLGAAAKQLAETVTFVKEPVKCAVLLVNSGGPSADWKSFFNLANHYRARFPIIDAVFALSVVPMLKTNGEFQLQYATISDTADWDAADPVGNALDDGIKTEIEKRTGRTCKAEDIDAQSVTGKRLFRLSKEGVRPKL